MLDKSKPHGIVYGIAGAAFEQAGKLFDVNGVAIGKSPEKKVPDPVKTQPKAPKKLTPAEIQAAIDKEFEPDDGVLADEKPIEPEDEKKKPPSQMNVAELLKEGVENGKDFSGMTKKVMVKKVRKLRGLS